MEELMQVIIGIDPHKASHTAVAVSGDEDELARLKVRASRGQVDQLLTWAAPFPSRTWAIEGAEGLGFLLAHSSSPPARRSSMCRRRWRRARVCSALEGRTRTTPTTRCLSR
jgi:hypothetical protein